jgi:hypothetical protein
VPSREWGQPAWLSDRMGTYLKKLIYGIRDAQVPFQHGLREINIRRSRRGRLHRPRFALFAHFRRLLSVLQINPVPFLDPFVGWLRGLDDQSARDVFLMSLSDELEKFKLLFSVKLGSERSFGN